MQLFPPVGLREAWLRQRENISQKELYKANVSWKYSCCLFRPSNAYADLQTVLPTVVTQKCMQATSFSSPNLRSKSRFSQRYPITDITDIRWYSSSLLFPKQGPKLSSIVMYMMLIWTSSLAHHAHYLSLKIDQTSHKRHQSAVWHNW